VDSSAFASPSSSAGSNPKLQEFLQWFAGLEADEQDVLMNLVIREKKVRDVVKTLGGMGLEQRREVFERLGLPADLVSRIPAPDPATLTEAEVEWVDWKAPGS
jgi:hypothetical protein